MTKRWMKATTAIGLCTMIGGGMAGTAHAQQDAARSLADCVIEERDNCPPATEAEVGAAAQIVAADSSSTSDAGDTASDAVDNASEGATDATDSTKDTAKDVEDEGSWKWGLLGLLGLLGLGGLLKKNHPEHHDHVATARHTTPARRVDTDTTARRVDVDRDGRDDLGRDRI